MRHKAGEKSAVKARKKVARSKALRRNAENAKRVQTTKVFATVGQLLTGDAINKAMVADAATPRRVATLMLSRGDSDELVLKELARRFADKKGRIVSRGHWRNPKGKIVTARDVKRWRARLAQGRVQTIGRAPADLLQKWQRVNKLEAREAREVKGAKREARSSRRAERVEAKARKAMPKRRAA